MGLIDEKCDSCGDKKSALVPLAVLDELPTGGMRMVVKYYCRDCADTYLDEAEDIDKEEEDEEEEEEPEDPDRDY
jgi:hypothetical protein